MKEHTAIITYLLNGTVQATKAKLYTNRLTQSLIDELGNELTKAYEDELAKSTTLVKIMYATGIKVEVINVMILEDEEYE